MAIVKGTNGWDTIGGWNGATNDKDVIFGYDGYDTLYGEGGDDILKGGGGGDELYGGAGKDWADYSDSTDRIHVDLEDNFAYGGTAEGDTFDSIENVNGSSYDDMISGDGKVNRLHGGAGDDDLLGGGGGDHLDGGDGFDFAHYGPSMQGVTVNLYTGYTAGADAKGDTFVSIEGLAGTGYDDNLSGNNVDNTLVGYAGDDTLKGYGGNDTLEGGYGADLMFGGMGNDDYEVDEAGDVVYELGDSGHDGVYSDISYTLPDNVEYLRLTDEGVGIEATGNALGNTIVGNDLGNAIEGRGGKDAMFGHGGGDWFVWQSTDHSGIEHATADVLYDFNFAEGDLIHLSFIDADVYAPGNQTFNFIGTAAFSGTPGEINYYHANGSTYIQLQTGMSTDVESVIRIDDIVTPQASWFAL
jgi:Ca2+-binding RTX toxin-like protein